MLHPQSLASASTLDIRRLHEYISDMRHMNRLVGESFNRGYQSNYAPGLDCRYREFYQHPLLHTFTQLLNQYEVTTNQIYLTELEHQLLILTKLTDPIAAHESLRKLLSESKILLHHEPQAEDLLGQIAYLAHGDESAARLTGYFNARIKGQVSANNPLSRVLYSLNTELEKVAKLQLSCLQQLHPDSSADDCEAMLAEQLPHRKIQTVDEAALTLNAESYIKLYREIQNSVEALIAQHDDPLLAYQTSIKPLIINILKSKPKSMGFRLINEALNLYVQQLDNKRHNKHIIEITTLVKTLNYAAKLSAFKQEGFSDTILTAVLDCIETNSISPEQVVAAVIEQDYQVSYGQFFADLNRGTALNFHKQDDNAFKQDAYELRMQLSDPVVALDDVKQFTKQLGVNEFITRARLLLEVDALFNLDKIQQHISKALLLSEENDMSFSELVEEYLAKMETAHRILDDLGVKTQSANELLAEIRGQFPCQSLRSVKHLAHLLSEYFVKSRNDIVEQLVELRLLDKSPQQQREYLNHEFSLLCEQPNNVMLREFLFYANSTLLAQLDLANPTDRELFDYYTVRLLAYHFLKNNNPLAKHGYYPELQHKIISLIRSDELTIDSLAHTIRDHSTKKHVSETGDEVLPERVFKQSLVNVKSAMGCEVISPTFKIAYRFSKERFSQYMQQQLRVNNPLLTDFLPLRTHQGYMKLPYNTAIEAVSYMMVTENADSVSSLSAPSLMYHPGNADIFNVMRSGDLSRYAATATFNFSGYRRLSDPSHVVTTQLPCVFAHARYAPHIRDLGHDLPHQFSQLGIALQSNVFYVSDEVILQKILQHAMYANVFNKIRQQEYLSADDWLMIDSFTRPYLNDDGSINLERSIPTDVLLALAWRDHRYLRAILSTPELSAQLFYPRPDSASLQDFKADIAVDISANYAPSFQLFPSYSVSDKASLPWNQSAPSTPNLQRLLSVLLLRYSNRTVVPEAEYLTKMLDIMNSYSMGRYDMVIAHVVKPGDNVAVNEFSKALAFYLPTNQQKRLIDKGGQDLITREPELVQQLLLDNPELVSHVIYYYDVEGIDLVPMIAHNPELWGSTIDRQRGYLDRSQVAHQLTGEQLLRLIRTFQKDYREQRQQYEAGTRSTEPYNNIRAIASVFERSTLVGKLANELDKLTLAEFVEVYEWIPLSVRQRFFDPKSLMFRYLHSNNRHHATQLFETPLSEETAVVLAKAIRGLVGSQDPQAEAICFALLKKKISSLEQNNLHLLFTLGLSDKLLLELMKEPSVCTQVIAFIQDASFDQQQSLAVQQMLESGFVNVAGSGDMSGQSASAQDDANALLEAVSMQQVAKQRLTQFFLAELNNEMADEPTLLACYRVVPEVIQLNFSDNLNSLQRFPMLYEQILLERFERSQTLESSELEACLAHLTYSDFRPHDQVLARAFEDNAQFKAYLLAQASPFQLLMLSISHQTNYLTSAQFEWLDPKYQQIIHQNFHDEYNPNDEPSVTRCLVAASTGDRYTLSRVIDDTPALKQDPEFQMALWALYVTKTANTAIDSLATCHEIAKHHPLVYARHPLRHMLVNNRYVRHQLALDSMVDKNPNTRVKYAKVLANFMLDELAIDAASPLLTACCEPKQLNEIFFWLTSVTDGVANTDLLVRLFQHARFQEAIIELIIRYPNMQVQLVDSQQQRMVADVFAQPGIAPELKHQLACHCPELLADPIFAGSVSDTIRENLDAFSTQDLQKIMTSLHPRVAKQLAADKALVNKLMQVSSHPAIEALMLQSCCANPEFIANLDHESLLRTERTITDVGSISDIKLVCDLATIMVEQLHNEDAQNAQSNYTQLLSILLDAQPRIVYELTQQHNYLNALQILQLIPPDESSSLARVQRQLVESLELNAVLSIASSRALTQLVLNPNIPIGILEDFIQDKNNAQLLMNPNNQDDFVSLIQSTRFHQLLAGSCAKTLAPAVLQPKLLLLEPMPAAHQFAVAAAISQLSQAELQQCPLHNEFMSTLCQHSNSAEAVSYQLVKTLHELPKNSLPIPELIARSQRLMSHMLQTLPALTHLKAAQQSQLQQYCMENYARELNAFAEFLNPEHKISAQERLVVLRQCIADIQLFTQMATGSDKYTGLIQQQLVSMYLNTELFPVCQGFANDIHLLQQDSQLARLLSEHVAKQYLHGSPRHQLDIVKTPILRELLFSVKDPALLNAILSHKHLHNVLDKGLIVDVRRELLEVANQRYDEFKPHAELLAACLMKDDRSRYPSLTNQPEVIEALLAMEPDEALTEQQPSESGTGHQPKSTL